MIFIRRKRVFIFLLVLLFVIVVLYGSQFMRIDKEKPNPQPITGSSYHLRDSVSLPPADEVKSTQTVVSKNLRTETKKSENEEILNPRTGVSYNVHTFYYPWYGSRDIDGQWSHWNHETIPHWTSHVNKQYPKRKHVPPDDIASKFYPQLGPYSSTDKSVIRNHMEQLVKAGIGVLSVSWYPPETHDDNAVIFVDQLIPTILAIADEYEEKVCFHIEPYNGRTARTVKRDIEYIINTYGDHPAFYRHRGKPLVYIYDSYHIEPDEWAKLFSPHGSFSIRNTKYDIYAIGLLVERKDCASLLHGGFDGWYTYFAAQNFVYGSTIAFWPTIKSCGKGLFIPSVGPGYDDSPVRPWNGANTKRRNNGDYYREMWKAALNVGAEIISITSFNEWHEGTQIEAAIPKSTYEDYGDDPDFYLKITKEMVQKMHNLGVCLHSRRT